MVAADAAACLPARPFPFSLLQKDEVRNHFADQVTRAPPTIHHVCDQLHCLLLFCPLQKDEVRNHFADQVTQPPVRFVNSRATTFSCVDARGDASMLVSGVCLICVTYVYVRQMFVNSRMFPISCVDARGDASMLVSATHF
jgi:hypothetical protein